MFNYSLILLSLAIAGVNADENIDSPASPLPQFSVLPAAQSTTQQEKATNSEPTKPESATKAISDYAETLRKQASEVVQEQLQKLYDSAGNTGSPDKRNIKGFVTSTEVRTFKDIDANMVREIDAVLESIRALIFRVATDIEQHGSSGTVRLESGQVIYEDLPRDAVEEYKKLMEAKEKNNVSVRSIQLAIQMLSDLNKQIMAEAKKEQNTQKKRKLYVTQAAFVYEMSSIVCDLLDQVSLEGKADIEKISNEHQQQVQQRLQQVDGLMQRLHQHKSMLPVAALEAQERSFQLLRAANETTLKTWQQVMERVTQQDNALQKIKDKKSSVELVRDSAKIQLETLRDIIVAGEFQSFIGDMDSLVAVVEGLDLLELTQDEVSSLFGRPIRSRE